MLLTLCDNVLAIIRACSQTEKACSRFLPIARSAGGCEGGGNLAGDMAGLAHADADDAALASQQQAAGRPEEHTSELQSLMRIPYAVFCLKKKKHHTTYNHVL